MMLLTPLIMIPIFGSMLWRGRSGIPESLRPLVAIGGMVFVLFGVVQLMANQFGFDRDGFRVFVLVAGVRRDILLGKNLVIRPVGAGLASILLDDRAGGLSPAAGPLPGHVPAVCLDVSACSVCSRT